MIKISICFIVGEARPAGTRSHSATERERERQKDRQPKKKERGEREIRAIKRRERERKSNIKRRKGGSNKEHEQTEQ